MKYLVKYIFLYWWKDY